MSDNIQVSRWVFTLHHYDGMKDYKDYLFNERFDIKRGVLGYESINNRQNYHIQAYLEFNRSHRFTFVKRILNSAHWQRAVGNSSQNYTYCTKSKVYELIGDWSDEQRTRGGNVTGTIIKGLLSDYAAQIKCCREYMVRPKPYDSAASLVSIIKDKHYFFKEFQNCKLSNWQFEIFKLLINQSERQVLWVSDNVGRTGKTFFCKFLRNLYNFFLTDGTVDSRDMCYFLPEKMSGILFDVCRDLSNKFNYAVLESVKNGWMISGKYEGKLRNFGTIPVAVFANFLPDLTKLSQDTWNIVELGKGPYHNANTIPLHSTITTLPYVKPPILPELNDKIDIIKYLEVKLRQEENVQRCPIPSGK